MVATSPLPIHPFPPSAASDEPTTAAIADLINAVYRESEGDLLLPDTKRTNNEEIARLIAAGEMHGARDADGTVVGVVRLHVLDHHDEVGDETILAKGNDRAAQAPVPSTEAGKDKVTSLGLLAVALAHRGSGLGKRLVLYAEDAARQMGCKEMEIHLLVTADGKPHAFKDFLDKWYHRLGYVEMGRQSFAEFLPAKGKVLARECDIVTSRKALT